MAKMFYNIDEAAERLGLKPDEVRKLVDDGKLQQFRDRDKLMFKRDQVDEMASLKDTIKISNAQGDDDTGELELDDTVDALSTKTDKIELISDDAGATDAGGSSYELVLEEEEDVKKGDTDLMGADIDPTKIEDTGELGLADTGSGASAIQPSPKGKPGGKADTMSGTAPISLDDTGSRGGTEAMDAMEVEELEELNLEDEAAKTRGPASSATRTGINIFDTQEVDAADSMARTQVTKAFKEDEEDLNLESVGSGSGLLDLTREADDTSLGAVELLDEVAPAGESAAGGTVGGTIGGSMPGSSTGIFEGTAEGAAEGATSGSIVAVEEGTGETEPEMVTTYAVASEDADVFGGLTLMGVFAVLVVATIVAITGFQGQIIQVTELFVTPQKDPNRLMMLMGGLAVFLIILLVVDFVMGKKRR